MYRGKLDTLRYYLNCINIYMTDTIPVNGIYTPEVQQLFDYTCTNLDKLNIKHDISRVEAFRNIDASGIHRDPLWKAVVLHKVIYGLNLVKKLSPGEVIILSDMDVQPLQNYSKLLCYLDHHDICFMDEDDGRGGINTGFILLRKTENVINLFEDWLHQCQLQMSSGEFLDDQVTLNNCIRVDKTYNYFINKFPVDVITGRHSQITQRSVGFHAIRCKGSKIKLKRMKLAYDIYNRIITL